MTKRSNLQCSCGGNIQILRVYENSIVVVRELGTSAATVLWVCLKCGEIDNSFVTVQEIFENEKIFKYKTSREMI